MRWMSQTLAVLALNIRTIPARLSSSAVAIIGIAGVVVVFVSVLSIAAGFQAAMQSTGAPDRRVSTSATLSRVAGMSSGWTSDRSMIPRISSGVYPSAVCQDRLT